MGGDDQEYHEAKSLDVEQVINDIKAGALNRNNDEKYANGFWDLAGELADNEEQQEAIYNALWSVYEIATAKDQNTILDSWHIDDVKSLDDTLTDDECRQVLQAAEHNFDATIGINWDVLQYHIDELKQDKVNEQDRENVRQGRVDPPDWK